MLGWVGSRGVGVLKYLFDVSVCGRMWAVRQAVAYIPPGNLFSYLFFIGVHDTVNTLLSRPVVA